MFSAVGGSLFNPVPEHDEKEDDQVDNSNSFDDDVIFELLKRHKSPPKHRNRPRLTVYQLPRLALWVQDFK